MASSWIRSSSSRRQFEEADDCVLKVIAVNGKLIFTGEKSIIEVCRKQFSNNLGNWFMDDSNFRKLDEILKKDGYRVKTAHSFFIPKDDCVHEIKGVETKNTIRKKFSNLRIMTGLRKHFVLAKSHRMCLQLQQLYMMR